MRSPQTLTRRLVPALAVTIVATLIFGALVVTADVADGTEPLLPESFSVAAPRQGDAWRYNVTLAGDWTFGLEDQVRVNESLPFGTFQWAGTGKVRGGDGFLHDANRFHAETLHYQPLYLEAIEAIEDGVEGNSGFEAAESPYWSDGSDSAWIAAGAQEVLARGNRYSLNDTQINYGIPMGTGVMGEWTEHYSEFGYVEFPAADVPCLVFNPLQGANASLGAPLVLFEACSLGGEFLPIPQGLSFRAQAVENVSGVQAIRFDGELNGTYQAWFTPAVPYPVRIAFQLPSEREAILEEGDRDLPGARSAVLEMVGFQPGPEELDVLDDATEPAPAFMSAAPLEVNGIWAGLSEEGIAHPFPLSAALTAAMAEQGGFPDLRLYLQAAPDAYVAAAEYVEGNDIYVSQTSGLTPSYAYAWAFVLSDGEETFEFTAVKETYRSTVPEALRGTAPNATADSPVITFERGAYGAFGYYTYSSGQVYPSRLPAEMPTVASLAERWAVFDGSNTAFNSWGFSIDCIEVDPCQAGVAIFAGHLRQSYDGATPYFPFAAPGNPYGVEERAQIERLVVFQEDGTADLLLVQDEREYRSSGTSPPSGVPVPISPPEPPQDPGYGVRSTEVSGIPSSSFTWVPEPKEAASIGFMGLVVGALYWIWPKLGMVGLFSRLHRGELLDHPARAKLVQIVESQPGIHFHDLATKAELANGTAVHHLRKLSDSGHLSVRRSGRYTCYFPGGRVDPHAAAAAPLLKSDGAKQILEAVRNKPGMSNLELAQATGLQPSTVNYHVQRLANAGLVAALRDGRSVRLHPGARSGGESPAAAA